MKKTLIFTLIIAICALLCSCNMDAQTGIHAAIASSTKESTTKIKSYLGYYDNCHYILTDTFITRIGTGSSTFTNIPATGDTIGDCIEAAALLFSDGSILARKHDNTVVKYKNDGTKDSDITFTVSGSNVTLSCDFLMTNGTILGKYETGTGDSKVTKTGLFKSDGTAIVAEIKNFRNILESGDYTLIEATKVDDSTSAQYFIYKKDGTSAIASRDVTATGYKTVGFQAVTSGTSTDFYILKSDYNVYKLTVSDTTLTSKSYATVTTSPNSTDNFSFTYTSGSDTYIVFKLNSNFVRIKLGDSPTVSTISSGYSSLKQTEVVNILPDESDTSSTKFIVATWSNSLWQIDPTTTSDPVDLLN